MAEILTRPAAAWPVTELFQAYRACHRACLWHRIVESFNGRINHVDRQTGASDTSPCFTAAGIGVNDVLAYVRQLLAVMRQYICIIDRYRYLPVINGRPIHGHTIQKLVLTTLLLL